MGIITDSNYLSTAYICNMFLFSCCLQSCNSPFFGFCAGAVQQRYRTGIVAPPHWEFLVPFFFYAIDYEVHAIPGFLNAKAAVLKTR
jgi:hypothetical protein